MIRRAALLLVLVLLPASAAAQFSPDFCATPSKTASTGNWNTAGTWSPSGVPGAGAVVVIPSGATVTYDLSSTTVMESVCVESGGLLTFQTNANTKLTVEDFVIEMGGELRIGTAGAPISSANTAEVVFDCNSTCLDTGTAGSPGVDPEQFGLGLIAEGKVQMHGNVKTPFLRLAVAPAAAATTLTLASIPTGWASGDAVVIPESVQRSLAGSPAVAFQQHQSGTCAGTYCRYDDRRVLNGAVSTTTATVTAGLTNAHPGGLNAAGGTDYFPHIGNLTRNVTLRSANPGGTRGHTMFTHMADVDIRYVLFKDLGRTTDNSLHCTLKTAGAIQENPDCEMGTGNYTQIGTNQKGRYAVHFHHLWGPTNVGNTGFQGQFVGNAVVDSTKWPISIHWTCYLNIQNNVIAYGNGPGIFFEEYNEHFNVVDGNFITGMSAHITPRDSSATIRPGDMAGREAAGVWSRSVQNYFRNNVAAGFWNSAQEIVNEVGYKFAIRPADWTVRIPKFRGADLTNAADYTTSNAQSLPMLEFDNNEAYGMSAALTIWQHGTDGYVLRNAQPVTTISDLVAWNIYEEGFFGYPIYNYIFDGMIVRGDPTKLVSAYATPGTMPYGWTSGDYKNHSITIKNSDFQNVGTGIGQTYGLDGGLTIQNVITKTAAAGIEINGYFTPGAGSSPTNNRVTTITGHTHTPLAGYADRPLWLRFDAYGACCGGSFYADTLTYATSVTNYKGLGSSFDVYFDEQASQAYAGGLAPCSDTTTYPEIDGIVCNIHSSAPPTNPKHLRFRIRGEDLPPLWTVFSLGGY